MSLVLEEAEGPVALAYNQRQSRKSSHGEKKLMNQAKSLAMMALHTAGSYRVLAVFVALAASFSGVSGSFADTTPAQRREIAALKTELRKASSLFTKGEFDTSGSVVRQVQAKVEELAAGKDADLLKAMDDVYRRLVRAHALLELEGIELSPLRKLGEEPDPSSSGDMVSFAEQVAPVLVTRCGRCHITNSRGDFSLATYSALMRGSSAGVVIFPGDAPGSRIVEVIESGDMPRGGQMPDAEFTLLKNWIKQGARFDGDNENANLTTYAPSSNPQQSRLEVVQATGKETMSFAVDVAPLLAQNCNGCHVNAQRASGNFNMTTFARMLRGGDSGAPLVPGKPAESLIVQRLKGEGGQRMPQRRPPLSDEAIARIEKWIEEGAKFDGMEADQDIVRVAATAKAQRATHEQLSADRREQAATNWRLGMGSTSFESAESENFLLMGTGSQDLEAHAKQAEKLVPRIAKLLSAPTNQPLVKGKMTLFLFDQRYDYSEFGQMVEKRELPKDWRGHWRYNIVDAYGVMLPPANDDEDYTIDGLLTQQIAAVYVASLNDAPRWFSEGAGRMVASRLAPRDPRVRQWSTGLPKVLASMQKTTDFQQGRMPAEQADIASFSFVDFLTQDMKRFRNLLNGLREGQAFNRAFAASYGGSPAKVSEIWARHARSKRR